MIKSFRINVCILLLLGFYFSPGDTGAQRNSSTAKGLEVNTKHLTKQDKPNIIIIVADDMGYGDISCYGNEKTKTPNLDQMAREGVRFLDFHSNGAVCSPTRAALLTGKYQQRTGITGVITAAGHRKVGLSLSENTIAETLKRDGYATGIFGKWHLGYAKKYNPLNQGFDEFKGYVSGNVDYISHIDQAYYLDWWKDSAIDNEPGYTTDLIEDYADDFIRRNQHNPFLLFITHEAPHSPYQVRESKPTRSLDSVSSDGIAVNLSKKEIAPLYQKMVEIMDENIGKTLRTLKDLKLDDNTIVIFCSDNGAYGVGNNGGLRGIKGFVWEGGHRVPAIIRWPGHIKPGWLSNETVLTMDIYPTLLELTGAADNSKIDGVSFLSHLLYQKPLVERTLFWQIKDRFAARRGQWKMVVPQLNAPPELYNIVTDENETDNVADSHPEIVSDLLSAYKKWYAEVTKGVKIKS